MRLKTVGLSVS